MYDKDSQKEGAQHEHSSDQRERHASQQRLPSSSHLRVPERVAHKEHDGTGDPGEDLRLLTDLPHDDSVLSTGLEVLIGQATNSQAIFGGVLMRCHADLVGSWLED